MPTAMIEVVAGTFRIRYQRPVKNYVFRCIRTDGPGPAVHMDICSDDADAQRRAQALFTLWPLAVKVDVSQADRHFEVVRPV